MPKGRGFPGRTLRTRHAHPKGRRCDRLTRSLDSWLSSPLHRRRFPQALRYEGSLAHSEPERHSSPGLKSGVFWRRMISPQSMAPELEFSDAGNALRLARKYGAGLKYVRQWGWMIYRAGRWQRDEIGYAMQCAKACVSELLVEAAQPETDITRRLQLLDHARRSFNANRLHSMLKLAESEPGMVARVEDYDTDVWLLNVLNGTLDLRTGARREHNPDDMLTKLAPVLCDRTAAAPAGSGFCLKSSRAIPTWLPSSSGRWVTASPA